MDEIVIPTILEAKAEPRSRRRAYLACIVTFHLNDYLKSVGHKKTEDKMRVATGDAFDVVRGVCNGTKHVQTNDKHPIPFTSGKDWYRPPAIAGLLVLGLSRLGDSKGGREIGSGADRKDIYGAVKSLVTAFVASYPSELGASDLSGI